LGNYNGPSNPKPLRIRETTCAQGAVWFKILKDFDHRVAVAVEVADRLSVCTCGVSFKIGAVQVDVSQKLGAQTTFSYHPKIRAFVEQAPDLTFRDITGVWDGRGH